MVEVSKPGGSLTIKINVSGNSNSAIGIKVRLDGFRQRLKTAEGQEVVKMSAEYRGLVGDVRMCVRKGGEGVEGTIELMITVGEELTEKIDHGNMSKEQRQEVAKNQAGAYIELGVLIETNGTPEQKKHLARAVHEFQNVCQRQGLELDDETKNKLNSYAQGAYVKAEDGASSQGDVYPETYKALCRLYYGEPFRDELAEANAEVAENNERAENRREKEKSEEKIANAKKAEGKRVEILAQANREAIEKVEAGENEMRAQAGREGRLIGKRTPQIAALT